MGRLAGTAAPATLGRGGSHVVRLMSQWKRDVPAPLACAGPPSQSKATGVVPPASWLPAPPQVGTVGGRFVVERVPTDRRLRQGTHTVERPWHGRGLCLRVLELKGRSPGGLHLQIQDAEVCAHDNWAG